MITVKVDTRQIERRLQAMAGDQVPFAIALGLTRTAQEASRELAVEMPKHLDSPTPFTLRAFAVERATKQGLVARVYARPAQAKYLKYQIDGGDRAPTRKAQRLPSEVRLNEFGNLPRGMIRDLIQIARSSKRLTAGQARKQVQKMRSAGVSAALDLFYGDPGNGKPVGIYKRMVRGGQQTLVPLILMPERSVRYRPRFPAAEIVRRVAVRAFPGHFKDALRRAIDTAR